ncbi:MAG: endonuclease/exonuclease/phosphatase family protein [Tepidisphaeraceae bacterium]
MEKNEAACSTAKRPRRHSRVIAWLSWIYAAQIIAAWLFLRLDGDRSWLGAIAIFSPRWVVILPLVPLVPLALAFNRRCLWILAVATAGALFWVMGLCLPWRAWIAPGRSDLTVRVLTCNVHGHALHSRQLADLIASVHPDVVVLQEWLPPYESSIFDDGDWNVVTAGEQFLATRFRVNSFREFQNGSAVRYVLETSAGTFNLINVHLASPHPPLAAALLGRPGGKTDLEKNVIEREDQSRHLARVTGNASGPLLIAGDFNLCPDSPIFRENFRHFSDAFDVAGFGFGWTYRVQWTAARIDHILSSSQWTCRDCWLGISVGSPHRPLIADFSLSNAP